MTISAKNRVGQWSWSKFRSIRSKNYFLEWKLQKQKSGWPLCIAEVLQNRSKNFFLIFNGPKWLSKVFIKKELEWNLSAMTSGFILVQNCVVLVRGIPEFFEPLPDLTHNWYRPFSILKGLLNTFLSSFAYFD